MWVEIIRKMLFSYMGTIYVHQLCIYYMIVLDECLMLLTHIHRWYTHSIRAGVHSASLPGDLGTFRAFNMMLLDATGIAFIYIYKQKKCYRDPDFNGRRSMQNVKNII